MTCEASTVVEYIDQIPEDRRETFRRLLAAWRDRIAAGYTVRMKTTIELPDALYRRIV